MTKYGIMIVATVLLVGLAFAGAASADGNVTIYNATGAHILKDNDVIYGDGGHGTATFEVDSSGEDSWFLTLNNFNVTCNGVSIINSTVANLTIVLNGESNITGSYADEHKGLVYSSGNLTIKDGENKDGKLLVNDTVFDGDDVFTICVNGMLSIDNVHQIISIANCSGGNVRSMNVLSGITICNGSDVTVIANSSIEDDDAQIAGLYNGLGDVVIDNSTVKATVDGKGGTVFAIFSGLSDIVAKGSKSEVTATANCGKGSACGLYTMLFDIDIDSVGVLDATANGNTSAYALYGGAYSYMSELDTGDVSLINVGTINATANSSTGKAFAINASKSILIDNVRVVNATAYGKMKTSAICSDTGNIIVNGSKTTINVNASSSEYEAYTIWAGDSIQINSAKIVNVTAEGIKDTHAFIAENNVNLTNITTISAVASCKGSNGCAETIYSYRNVLIDSVGVLNVTARYLTTSDDKTASAIYANGGNITVTGEKTRINATAEGIDESVYTIEAGYSIVIDAIDMLNATACSKGNTFAMLANYGINITGTDTKIDAKAISENGCANAIYNQLNSIQIDSAKLVNATANGKNKTIALGSIMGDIDIAGSETVIDAKATSAESVAFTIVAGNNLTIESVKRLIAVGNASSGTATSFAYNMTELGTGKLDIENLKDYTFSNATDSSKEPTTYGNFSKWREGEYMEGMIFRINNYTAVKIENESVECTVTYDKNGATNGVAPKNQTAAKGSEVEVADKGNLTRFGYNFTGWNNKTDGTGTNYYPHTTFTVTANITLYANWTVNKTNTTANSDGVATFGGDNYTALKNTSKGVVTKVCLDNVSNVKPNTEVNFTAENISVGEIPDIPGHTKVQISVFEINATVEEGHQAQFNMTFTFADEQTAKADMDKIHFWHFNTSKGEKGDWDEPSLHIASIVQNDANVTYTVETNSFSTFGHGHYTPNTQPYTPSSSKPTGSTIILQDGVVTPTVEPTVTPTEKTATSTIIATATPTTQPTQQSPAPVVGLIAGLGAAALVLARMRR